MKAKIHPQYFDDAKVTCACGNTFTTGATSPELKVEVCYSCHPFYTGTMKLLDTAGRVDAFKAKLAGSGKAIMSKTEKRKLKREKRLQDELNRPESLAQLRSQS